MKRSALGKGIAALIPEAPAARLPGVVDVPVTEIRPNPCSHGGGSRRMAWQSSRTRSASTGCCSLWW